MARHSRLNFQTRQSQTQLRRLAARCARVVHELFPSQNRGRRERRVPVAPAASCVKKQTHELVTTGSPGSPGIPCTMVLTAYFVLSPVIGLYCHRRLRSCLRRLDAGVEASGPHDFAVRTLALSSAAPPASTASHPASVTIAIRPSGGRDGGGYRSDLGQSRRGKFLKMGLDRGIKL